MNPINAVPSDPTLDLFSKDGPSSGEVATAPLRNPHESMLRKCLHPPSAVPGFDGLPTNDARTQVLLQYTNVGINATPYIVDHVTSVVRAVTAADLTTFDYAILIPNGLRVNAIPFVYNTTTNSLEQDYNNVDIQDAYEAKNFQDDAQLYRPVYSSSTYMLNATAFNDTGLVTSNQFNPNIMFAGTLLTLAHTQQDDFNHFVRSHVQRLRKRGLSPFLSPNHDNYHTYREAWNRVPGYVRDEMHRVVGSSRDDVLDLDPNVNIQVVSFGKGNETGGQVAPVPTPSQLMNQSTRSYTGKARDGLFAVQRINTVSPGWNSAGNTNTPYFGLYQCYFHFRDPAGISHFVAFSDNVAVGTPTSDLPFLLDTLWTRDMTWTWVYFQGLSLNSQTSVSTQLISKKYYRGFEVQPAFRSAWAGLTRLGPEPNLQAMQAMMDGFYQMKDAMPACYNFWGTIGTILGPSLLKAGGSVLSWLTNKLTPAGDQSKAVNQVRAAKQKPTLPPPAPPSSTFRGQRRATNRVANDENRIDKLASAVQQLSLRVARSTSLPVRPSRSTTRRVRRPITPMPAPRIQRQRTKPN